MTKDGLNAQDAAKALGVSRRTMFAPRPAARLHVRGLLPERRLPVLP
jgi:predicted DNA-binding protein (UPF0251 family)